jgi:hypothetical protein
VTKNIQPTSLILGVLLVLIVAMRYAYTAGTGKEF